MTGVDALESIQKDLAENGITFGIARAKGVFRATVELSGVAKEIGSENFFPTIHAGVHKFLISSEAKGGSGPPVVSVAN